MAAENGGASASLIERLFAEGFAFDFFQAVRLLEKVGPERGPVGHDSPPSEEVARFRAHLALSFPASAIYQIEAPNGPAAPTMTVTFMGLTGPSGVLPRHYTEMLMRAREVKGPERFVARDWFDLFNHRFISLFYRTWTKYRFWLTYERGEFAKLDPDLFTESLFSLIGMGTKSLRNRLRVAVRPAADGAQRERILARVEDLSLIYYAGLFAHRPRCAISLERLLTDYFGVPARVVQFQGQWLRLDPENQSQLLGQEEKSAMGMNAIVGDRVWNIRSKIRICLGPLNYERFASFLPDQSTAPERKDFFRLMHLVRLYVGPELKVDIQLILKASEIPRCKMLHEGGKGPRLGWNTWMTSRPMLHDSHDAVFDGFELSWAVESDASPAPQRATTVDRAAPA